MPCDIYHDLSRMPGVLQSGASFWSGQCKDWMDSTGCRSRQKGRRDGQHVADSGTKLVNFRAGDCDDPFAFLASIASSTVAHIAWDCATAGASNGVSHAVFHGEDITSERATACAAILDTKSKHQVATGVEHLVTNPICTRTATAAVNRSERLKLILSSNTHMAEGIVLPTVSIESPCYAHLNFQL